MSEFKHRKFFEVRESPHKGYAEILDFKPEGFKQKKDTRADYFDLEKELIEKGFKGWIAWTTLGNLPTIKLMDHVGAKEYYFNGEDVFFFKELKKEEQNGIGTTKSNISGANSRGDSTTERTA